ncbi:MAG: response regulator [Magnetococcales bacterium]|nr:response regulator [Magnetococcales bacterium]
MNDPPADRLIQILLVDDQPTVHHLLHRMLMTQGGDGMVLHYVQDPLTAETKAQEIQPAVILLDLVMPGLDGLELLRRFRAHVVTRDVPIVMLSIVEDPHMKAEAFALGASDYITKLPDAVEMIARLRHHGNARLTQRHLEKSQQLLAETERIGKVGGWTFDIDTGQSTWTEEMYRIREWDHPHAPTLAEIVDSYTPASRPVIAQAVQRALEQGEPFDVELEIITAKGHLRHVHAIGKPDVQRRKISGFFQDITERKQSEWALRESERQMQEIAATLAEGLCVVDQRERITFINPAACMLLGWQEEAVLGKIFHLACPGSTCLLCAVLRDNTVVTTEDAWLCHRDRVNLFQTGNDAESRRYCFCLDISDWLWYERLT